MPKPEHFRELKDSNCRECKYSKRKGQQIVCTKHDFDLPKRTHCFGMYENISYYVCDDFTIFDD